MSLSSSAWHGLPCFALIYDIQARILTHIGLFVFLYRQGSVEALESNLYLRRAALPCKRSDFAACDSVISILVRSRDDPTCTICFVDRVIIDNMTQALARGRGFLSLNPQAQGLMHHVLHLLVSTLLARPFVCVASSSSKARLTSSHLILLRLLKFCVLSQRRCSQPSL